MSLALYRKYRPEKWGDVLGQDHVIDALKGALKAGDTAHAYLFAGSRGTGKTSIARILATEVGCSVNDLYEIDAASNRGIDDIRDLRESVRTLPFDSKYKVYIVDEVHMLTKEAFNALLKTLEEPPAHVIFVLATTEMHKIPDTVVSRCQMFQFKKPTQNLLKDLVLKTAKTEGYLVDPLGAGLIAMIGDGSFRDTQGVLQKVISASKGKDIPVSEVERVTGAPGSVLINSVIESIAESSLEKGIKAVHGAIENNVDMKIFVKLILHKLRAVLLLRLAPAMEEDIKSEFGEDDFVFIKELSSTSGGDRGEKGAKITSRTLKAFLVAYDELRYSALPQLPLELALIDIIGDNGTEQLSGSK